MNDAIILGDAPLRNLHAEALEEDGMSDGLVDLQRNDARLFALCLGAEEGWNRPHEDDWGRTGRYIAMHDSLEELEFGRVDKEEEDGEYIVTSNDIAFEHFESLCREMAGSKIERLTFYYTNLYGGKEFQALLPFLETTATLTQLRFGGDDNLPSPPPGHKYDDYAIWMLSQALFAFNSLTELSLPFIGIGDETVGELFEALEGHPGLQVLDLSGNEIGNRKSMGCLARFLGRPKSQLETLKLYLLNQSGSCDEWGMGDEGVEVLAPGIAASSALRVLDISRNIQITETGWRPLLLVLESPKCMLEELNLSSCRFNHDGMVCLAKALAINKSVKRLNLSFVDSEVRVTAWTWEAFFECLRESHLDELDLRGNQFYDRHASSLGSFLAGNGHLKKLDLSRNGGISAVGWRSIATSLRSPRTVLDELSIRWEVINGDEYVITLADTLTANRTLRQLFVDTDRDFTNLDITDAGWDAMSNALCDKTDIATTYNSNHTFCNMMPSWRLSPLISKKVVSLIELNRDNDNRRVARRKIIQTHFGQDNSTMRPLAEIELEVAPFLIAWLGRDDGRPDSEKEGKELLFRFFRSVPGLFSLRRNRKRKLRQATLLDMGYQRG